MGKESACNGGDTGSILDPGRSSGEGNGNQLQYFSLGNPRDRGAWWATVHGVTKELDTGRADITEQPEHLPYVIPGSSVVKNLPGKAGDMRDVGSIPGLGRSLGEGNGNPLQYCSLENAVNRGTW